MEGGEVKKEGGAKVRIITSFLQTERIGEREGCLDRVVFSPKGTER